MSDRRKIRDILWMALYNAKQYQESIIDCWDGAYSEKPVMEAKKDIKAINSLMVKLFGTNKSVLDVKLTNCKSISILELKKMFDTKL